MLIGFVVGYILISLAIGLYAATRVRNTKDYVVAGRSLPLYVVTATVFATWFGSETVLGISSTFFTDGLGGIVEDPFGASMCLILVGIFFAAKLYRMNLLTIGDYYRQRYNPVIELVVSCAIVVSYLGWVSAQIVALGVVFNVLSNGGVTMQTGMMMGAAIVVTYTLFGGMIAVAWTDFFQMSIIVLGLIYLAFVIGGKAGGASVVVNHAMDAGKFNFFPKANAHDILWFIGAWVTLMFGSIPQQDVFQRVTSAKNERIAVKGSILGGSLYFIFAFVPIFLVYSANLIDPQLVSELIDKDAQLILPHLILKHAPVFAQIIFFGALLSAIMSTASGTLLAPSVTFTENILKPLIGREMSDKRFLLTLRFVVVCFSVGVTTFALNSESNIYEMVGNAYCVTLVTAFIPLAMGVYWKRANSQGAAFSIMLGLATWLLLLKLAPEGIMPPQLAGLIASFLGMVIGSLLPALRESRTHPHHAGARV